MVKVLEKNEWVDVYIDEEIPVMVHKWKKAPDSDTFRSTLKNLQKLYIRNKDTYSNLMWLADTKHLGERTQEDEEWLSDTWEKLLFEDAGVSVHGVILSDDIYADYSMEKFKQKANETYAKKGVNLGVFMDSDTAYNWLRAFNK